MNSPRICPPLFLALALAACANDPEDSMVGTLERDRVELTVESNEPLLRIDVLDGQAVAAGDPLFAQDPARHAARLARQEAQRDQAAARLAELVRGPREEQIREARALLEASQAESANARRIYDRAQEVFDKGLSDPQTRDNAYTLWTSRQAVEQANREALARLLNGTTVEELQQAEAALQAAEASVRQARLDLERLNVKAPMAGTVDKVLFEVGERPAPGTTVAVLLDNSRPYARIYVPEHLRLQVQPGHRLEVAVDGVDETLVGTVSWVSADASFTPYFALTEHDRSRLAYLAEIELPDATGLPSGLPLEVWVPGDGE